MLSDEMVGFDCSWARGSRRGAHAMIAKSSRTLLSTPHIPTVLTTVVSNVSLQ